MSRRQLGFIASPRSPFLTLVSFRCLLFGAGPKHLQWCDVQTFDVSMSTRFEKVSGIVNISKMAGHAAQQRVLLECLEIGQMITMMYPQFLITNSIQQFGLLPHRLPKNARLLSLQNKPTRPATNLYSHHVPTDRVEEFTPSCAVTSRSGALPTPSRHSDVAQKT